MSPPPLEATSLGREAEWPRAVWEHGALPTETSPATRDSQAVSLGPRWQPWANPAMPASCCPRHPVLCPSRVRRARLWPTFPWMPQGRSFHGECTAYLLIPAPPLLAEKPLRLQNQRGLACSQGPSSSALLHTGMNEGSCSSRLVPSGQVAPRPIGHLPGLLITASSLGPGHRLLVLLCTLPPPATPSGRHASENAWHPSLLGPEP